MGDIHPCTDIFSPSLFLSREETDQQKKRRWESVCSSLKDYFNKLTPDLTEI